MEDSDPPAEGDGADGGTGVIRSQFEWSSTLPSTAVVEMIALATDRDPTGIQPLYASLDPDALDTLVASDPSADVRVSFVLADHEVTVDAAGAVTVRPVDDAA